MKTLQLFALLCAILVVPLTQKSANGQLLNQARRLGQLQQNFVISDGPGSSLLGGQQDTAPAPIASNAANAPTANSASIVQGNSVLGDSAMGNSVVDMGAGGCDTCPTGFGCPTGGCNDGLLFGLVKRSDHCYDCMISPMTNPVFFEDPRNLTEIRTIFLTHKVPIAAGGGNVQLLAAQIRARLSENVSFIATKDGFVFSDNPLIDDGWADVSAGLKFNLIRDPERQRLLSAGFTYELPTGEASALQGNGDGELNLFTTSARRLSNRVNWISAGGLRLPFNTTDESSSSYWSNHLDYRVGQRWYLLSEVNWYHWFKSGQDGAVPGIEGLDLFNLGSPGVAGNDIVTTAFGTKFKPNRHSELGFAFEFPVTPREDILDNRLTVDWIIRY